MCAKRQAFAREVQRGKQMGRGDRMGSQWGLPSVRSDSHRNARHLGEVHSGVTYPSAWPSPLGPPIWEGRGGGRPASLSALCPWPPLNCYPFKTGCMWAPLHRYPFKTRAASLCLVKLFSFRTGQGRGAGGRAHLLWNLREGLFINVHGSGFLWS